MFSLIDQQDSTSRTMISYQCLAGHREGDEGGAIFWLSHQGEGRADWQTHIGIDELVDSGKDILVT